MSSMLRTAGVLTLLLASACVETFTIPPSELVYLNGYNIRGEQSVDGVTYFPYRLVSTEGKPVDYNSSKSLYLLDAKEKVLAPTGPFETIFVTPDSIAVVPLKGPPVQVPLQSIQSVQISEYSAERTSQLVGVLSSLFIAGVAAGFTTH